MMMLLPKQQHYQPFYVPCNQGCGLPTSSSYRGLDVRRKENKKRRGGHNLDRREGKKEGRRKERKDGRKKETQCLAPNCCVHCPVYTCYFQKAASPTCWFQTWRSTLKFTLQILAATRCKHNATMCSICARYR